VDFSDPDDPYFCPCVYLLSVALHIFASELPLSDVAKCHALYIVHRCYLEVSRDQSKQRSV
jgi:hypothetical protein